MSWRIVNITKESKLSLKSNQLLYKPADNSEEVTIPLEDIAIIMADNSEISFSANLLQAIADNGIALFITDKSHLPSGIFLPFHKHSRYTEIFNLQINWSEPFKKRIWQKIIEQKIYNQFSVIKKINKTENIRLLKLSKSVLSGDSENNEAQAAKEYWQELFANFKRGKEDIKNKALNYGYAILRGAVARAVVSSGFMPSLGVFHSNNLNSFNLADDLIEPFRPFIDELVYTEFQDNEKPDLTPKDKQNLISVLTKFCMFDGEKITILKAIERSAETLQKATKEKDTNFLILPNLGF
ncbi:MAG: type II CRISPR-associated endonuclease Cas1 [Rickettsiales bacterium]|nr:type II CRISPR-associated endonuclease Cas1 [Rickettsiales bacterium]